ncbi:MAG: PEGA domain-containing protein [Acidobacteriota bacterium]|nr:PEGA domain-containing protein [Acidobacteriota bacterium]
MRPLLTARVIATLVLSINALAGAQPASAQDIVGGAARTDLSGGAGAGIRAGGGGGGGGTRRRPTVRNTATTTTVRTVTRTKTVVVTPTTGTLSVATEPGAAILVEPLRGGDALEGEVAKDERLFIFNNLKPGTYRVAAELEGYTDAEKEVTVIANRPASVTLELRPITHNVNITANVTRGEVRYAPVTGTKDPSTGEIKYTATGETRLAQIQNGRATLPNLRTGTYGIDIRSEEVGYQTLLATITLPGKTDYDVKLNKLLSSKTLSATWTNLEGWDAPGGWAVQTRKLVVRGPGVALPKDESYRYYSDFQLSSDAKMLNGVAASFAVRAQDKQNYYLIQLTGAKADEPYVLRGFLVKNGVPQRLGSPIPIDAFASTLKDNQFFNVSIKATDNSFNVSITDSQTGDLLPLGILTDPNRNFRVGAVGIAARDAEQNEIGRFIVCTPECPRG